MAEDLKKKEESLRMVISRLDAEIGKFSRMLDKLENKKEALGKTISAQGIQSVPVSFSSQAEQGEYDLVEELSKHLMSLDKLKKYAEQKLGAVLKEEELAEKLKKGYGKNAMLKRSKEGGFEVSFKDSETEQAMRELESSKKNIEQIKKTISEHEQ